jgi:NADH:ubiquinone oxidoreductase subunit 3 (subunit A)
MLFLNLKTDYFTTEISEFEILIILTTVIFLVSIILVFLSYFFSEQKADAEKNSIYECGFDGVFLCL